MEGLEVFVGFVLLCFTFATAIISIVNRVKDAAPRLQPTLVWLIAIVLGEALAFGVFRVMVATGVAPPLPLDVVAIVGLLIGLHASGLVDLSKFIGPKRE